MAAAKPKKLWITRSPGLGSNNDVSFRRVTCANMHPPMRRAWRRPLIPTRFHLLGFRGVLNPGESMQGRLDAGGNAGMKEPEGASRREHQPRAAQMAFTPRILESPSDARNFRFFRLCRIISALHLYAGQRASCSCLLALGVGSSRALKSWLLLCPSIEELAVHAATTRATTVCGVRRALAPAVALAPRRSHVHRWLPGRRLLSPSVSSVCLNRCEEGGKAPSALGSLAQTRCLCKESADSWLVHGKPSRSRRATPTGRGGGSEGNTHARTRGGPGSWRAMSR
jgi:hypothetical protein